MIAAKLEVQKNSLRLERLLSNPLVEAILRQWKGNGLEHLNSASFALGQLVPAGVLSFSAARTIASREAEKRDYDLRFELHNVESCISTAIENGTNCPLPANENDSSILVPPPCAAAPFDLDAPGGLLSSIARWIFETSPSPNAEFAILSAVAIHAALFGRKVITPDGLGLNVYMVMVGGTGYGKDRPLKALKQLASSINQKGVVGANDFASDSALEYILRHQPCQVLPMDEFGLVLSASGKNADPWSRARRKSLLELYSSSTSEWVAKVRASDGRDNKAPPPAIEWPTLSILAGTTPSTFYEGLEEDAFRSGLMARLLVVMVNQAPPLQRIDGFPVVTAELRTEMEASILPFKSGNILHGLLVADSPQYVTATWANGGSDAVAEIRNWARHVGLQDERRGQVVNRAGDYVSKLATIRAISRDSSAIIVTVADVRWAFGIVARSIATIEDGAERFMSGSPFETLCNAIREAVRQSKDSKGLKNSELLRKPIVKSAEPRWFDAAIKHLVATTGQLVNTSNSFGSGGKGGRYLLSSGVAE